MNKNVIAGKIVHLVNFLKGNILVMDTTYYLIRIRNETLSYSDSSELISHLILIKDKKI